MAFIVQSAGACAFSAASKGGSLFWPCVLYIVLICFYFYLFVLSRLALIIWIRPVTGLVARHGGGLVDWLGVALRPQNRKAY